MSLPEYQLFAKQAIYDANKVRFGHELLFRNSMNLDAKTVGGFIATSQVLVNYCSSIPDEVDFNALAFLNIDADFLTNNESLPVEPANLVLELNGLDANCVESINALEKWLSKGFRFALCGFEFEPSYISILKYFEFVKVDMLTVAVDTLGEKFRTLAKRPDQKWIAERIESEEIFKRCKEARFDLFQGYFLAQPQDLKGRSVQPGLTTIMQLIKLLDYPEVTIDEVADLVSRDPKLTLQMLNIINSSMFSMPRAIDDVKSLVSYLGKDLLRQWALILAFLSNGESHLEVSRLVLNRAKVCELLCELRARDSLKSKAFLAGLVSGVELLLDIPKEVFVSSVELDSQIKDALCNQSGELGEILNAVQLAERNIGYRTQFYQGIDEDVVVAFSLAKRWADEPVRVL